MFLHSPSEKFEQGERRILPRTGSIENRISGIGRNYHRGSCNNDYALAILAEELSKWMQRIPHRIPIQRNGGFCLHPFDFILINACFGRFLFIFILITIQKSCDVIGCLVPYFLGLVLPGFRNLLRQELLPETFHDMICKVCSADDCRSADEQSPHCFAHDAPLLLLPRLFSFDKAVRHPPRKQRRSHGERTAEHALLHGSHALCNPFWKNGIRYSLRKIHRHLSGCVRQFLHGRFQEVQLLPCCIKHLLILQCSDLKYIREDFRNGNLIMKNFTHVIDLPFRKLQYMILKERNLLFPLKLLSLYFPRKLFQKFTGCLMRCLRRSNDRLLCWHFWSGCARVLCEKTMLGTMCALPMRTEKNTHITLPYGRDASSPRATSPGSPDRCP